MSNFLFNSVQLRKPGRNVFSLSHDVKLTCEAGNLVPFFCQEVLPGDSFRVNTELLARLAPLTAPAMQRIDVYTHFFFVPNRLLWDNWEEFITGGEDGKSKPLFPQVTVNGVERNPSGLADYFGIPTGDTETGVAPVIVNALPFKAYQLIWNEFYRDQNLSDPIDIHPEIDGIQVSKDDPDFHNNLMTLRKRCWAKDYFTSALPWTQRGDDVMLPIAGTAPVNIESLGQLNWQATAGHSFISDSLHDLGMSPNLPGDVTVSGVKYSTKGKVVGGADFLSAHGNSDKNYNDLTFSAPNAKATADMSEISGVTINELRRANALQLWLEKNARGGARYIEQILSHFGVRVADYRLQRPQFLGGGKSPVMISEVLQNSATVDGQTPQGTMAGHGVAATANHAFKSSFYEHGYIIGILSIMPKASYMNGLPRMFVKNDKFDFAFPEFGNLGEQPIYNSEVYLKKDNSGLVSVGEDSGIFGYTPRYAEYKFGLSRVHGDFRTSLKFWHLARDFSSAPGLNEDFVTCKDTNLTRIFAVDPQEDQPEVDHYWLEIYNNVRAIRPLPKYVTPTL